MHTGSTHKNHKTPDHEILWLFLKALVPMLLLAVGIISFWYLNEHPPQATQVERVLPPIPSVSVIRVIPSDVTIPIYSRGAVNPSHQVQWLSEVAGEVTYSSPKLVTGGFFNKGDLLLKLDDTRYRLDVIRASAQIISARQTYQRAKEEAESAEDIPGLPSPKYYRLQKVEEALARLRAVEAEIALARLQVEKTRLLAPFTGRVQNSLVGEGQYLAPGAQLAQIYPIAGLEVRLPLTEEQLALLDVSRIYHPEKTAQNVKLKLEFAGKNYFWQGRILRTESAVDAQNQLLYAVVEIKDPYVKDLEQPDRPALSMGQLLEAEIQGKTLQKVMRLPGYALYQGNQVWVVEQGRLKQQRIRIVYKNKQDVYIQGGLRSGDLVVVSPADFAIEGMQVKSRAQEAF